jgi:hypothetical protein
LTSEEGPLTKTRMGRPDETFVTEVT